MVPFHYTDFVKFFVGLPHGAPQQVLVVCFDFLAFAWYLAPESPNFLRKWFYEGRRPIAVQHGLRLAVVGTGSIGYFSIGQLATQDRVGKICDTVLKSNMARENSLFQ